MAPPAPSSSQWGTHDKQTRGFDNLDLEESTKKWQELFRATNELDVQINRTDSHQQNSRRQSRVTGGLPPHILLPREDTRTLQSPSHTMHGTALIVAPNQTCPPTPAYDDNMKFVSIGQARPSMHPLLKKAVGNRLSVAVRQDSDVGSLDGGDCLSPIYKGKWRPQNSEDLESQSLPSTAASVNLSHDDGSHFPDLSQDSNDAVSRDIRANIADELDIVLGRNGDSWVNKKAWKDYCSESPSNGDDDDSSFVKGWKPTYCRDWVTGLPKLPPPVASCLHTPTDRHWECDIDPRNGFPTSPVEYPPTEINPKDPCNGIELDRRMRSTAAMRIMLEYPKMQKRVVNRERKEKEFNARNPQPPFVRKSRSPSPTPQPSRAAVLGPYAKASQEVNQSNVSAAQMPLVPVQQARHGDLNARRVRVPCHLRPAEPADVPQILAIYNWEVINGRQALDAKPLALRDVQDLLVQCKSSRTPFIVAVQGTAMEAAWRNESPAQLRGPYLQARQPRPYQKTTQTQPQSDTILGFGFISCPMSGLTGNVNSNVGRFIGRVHFYVENASRRNNIGRAILHKLTRCCSKAYFPVDWYEWHDPHRLSVFDEPDFNARNYSRLYIETSSTGEKDPSNAWYQKFLDGMGYLFMSTLDKTRKIGYGQDGEWLDTIVWQHDCREPKSIREND